MRRRTTLALVAGGTIAGGAVAAFARSLARGRDPTSAKPVSGIFPNGMAYLRLGSGPRTMLWIPGGPGNTLPTSGLARRMGESWSRPFIDEGYTVWWVTRKQNMPQGHSFADMADDYAKAITDEFGGKVDVVLGMSTGGQIGFYLAARHPDRFGHIVILSAGYEDNQRAKDLLLPSARLLGEGRIGEAMALMLEDSFPGWPRALVRILGAAMGRSMYGSTHPHFANDVMVEAEAELACDARDVLPLIPVPVLLVGGDRDPYFPREVYEETARHMPDCTLRLYEGQGHDLSVFGTRFAGDVLDFVTQRPETPRERSAKQPAVLGEPVGAASG